MLRLAASAPCACTGFASRRDDREPPCGARRIGCRGRRLRPAVSPADRGLAPVRALLNPPVMRLLPSFALALAVGSGCVVTTDGYDDDFYDDTYDSSLLVSNHSDFEIHEMYVTEIDNPSWGPNLLRGSILFPGDSIELAIDCGVYDAMLIDETGADCEVTGVELCFDDADWIIRNNTCSLFEARAAAALTGGK